MRKISRARRPSPALVVSIIALTVALGGTGYAAVTLPRNSVRASQIAANAVGPSEVHDLTLNDFRRDVRRRLQTLTGRPGAPGTPGTSGSGAPGSVGPQGVPGVPGAQGGRGATGATGSSAASMILGSTDEALITVGSSEDLYAPSGYTAVENVNRAYQTAPNATILVRDLYARIRTAPGAGASRTFQVKTATNRVVVSCTIADSATTCDSGSATGTVAPGERLTVSIFTGPAAPAASAGAEWGFRATTP